MLSKVTDFIPKFDASKPEEFQTFMRTYWMNVKGMEVPRGKQYLVLVNALGGMAKDVAQKMVDDFSTANPLLENGNQAQRAMLGERLRDELIAELETNPLVVGTRPTTKLLERFNKITQGPTEPVSQYYHRFQGLSENLRKQEPPVEHPAVVNYTTFVGHTPSTGLRPELQEYVKLHAAEDTVEAAVAAATKYENAGSTTQRQTGVNWLSVDQSTTGVEYLPRQAEPQEYQVSRQLVTEETRREPTQPKPKQAWKYRQPPKLQQDQRRFQQPRTSHVRAMDTNNREQRFQSNRRENSWQRGISSL